MQTFFHKLCAALRDGARISLPTYGCDRWLDIEKALIEQPIHNFDSEWMPSHGKRASWSPNCTLHGSSAAWRAANDLADEAAKSGASLQARRYRLHQRAAVLARAHAKARRWLENLYHASPDYVTQEPVFANHFAKWTSATEGRVRDS